MRIEIYLCSHEYSEYLFIYDKKDIQLENKTINLNK